MSGFVHGTDPVWSCNAGDPNTAPIPFIDACDDCALEAWERMTTGGIMARYGKHPACYPVIIAHIDGQMKWVPLAAR